MNGPFFLCLFLPVAQVVSVPFCTTLDLQLSFYRPLCYNSRAHCPLLRCLHTTSDIITGAHSYFMVSSFRYEGKKYFHWVSTQPSYVFVCYSRFQGPNECHPDFLKQEKNKIKSFRKIMTNLWQFAFKEFRVESSAIKM